MEDKKETKKKFDLWWMILLVALGLTILTFMLAPILIAIILFVLIFLPTIIYILIYKWIKRWFAASVFSFSVWLNIVILIIPIFGGLLLLDISKFSQEFQTNPKYVIVNDEGLIFGMNIDSFELTQNQEQPILTKQQLSSLQNEINSKVKGKIIFVLEKEVFRDVDSINFNEGIVLSKEEILEILKLEDFSSIMPAQLLELDANEIKKKLFFALVEKTLEENGSGFIIDELKNNNIKIYPERTSVKILIKILPTDLLGNYLPSGSSLVNEVNQQNTKSQTAGKTR